MLVRLFEPLLGTCDGLGYDIEVLRPGHINQLDSTVESCWEESVYVSYLYNSIFSLILVLSPTPPGLMVGLGLLYDSTVELGREMWHGLKDRQHRSMAFSSICWITQ